MDEALKALADRQGGVILRGQAHAAGYVDREICRLKERRVWTTVRRGAYAERVVWESLDELGKHRTTACAVFLQLTAPAAFSHVTAAVMLGLPVWNVDLSTVHVTRADRHSPRTEAGVHHHAGTLGEADTVRTADGFLITHATRTILDVARTAPFESAIVTADAALARRITSRDSLLAGLDRMRDWQGARSAGRVVSFADGRSESVGESRHRVQIRRVGLPAPELQVALGHHGDDRVDFYFEDFATVGEFDGRTKYERLLGENEQPGDAVWREKVREDRIRERGFQVVRSTWADLYRDEMIASRYRRAFARAGRRRVLA